ncbi:GlgB N-terminal domain-containing protein [Anaerococcus cruorum]|uniref:GlgB N-terminal domain-containing protein n=1 Tax=Anaerococcus sp. WGS1529 TaxID=3366812 RepID=UPI00372D0D9C
METKKFIDGQSKKAYEFFGNHPKDGGYIFRVFAPNAYKVELIGDFNDWQGQGLRKYRTGVFSANIKNAKKGDRYQYKITTREGEIIKKLDPYARAMSVKENCSLVGDDDYDFKNKKVNKDFKNIYQVHLGSLLKDETFSFDKLIDHCVANNFDCICLLPVTEYENYKSYGYKSTGLFAFAGRYGSKIDFKEFIDKAHAANIGVIVELDIYEFDENPYFLDNFDGTNLYTYDFSDIKYNFYGGLNFDPNKNASRSYILSVVNYWLTEFNLDGIALANIENVIYWQGQEYRGINQNWVELLEEIISFIHNNKAYAIANLNGTYNLDLSFDYVYDLSFRNILRIMQKSPFKRDKYKRDVQDLILADNSKKILGFSYVDDFLDEASLAMKMHGEYKLGQLKTLIIFLYSINASKMIFMGNELASFKTFSVFDKTILDTKSDENLSFNNFYKDLTSLCKSENVLFSEKSTTKLLDIGGYSIYAFIKSYEKNKLLVIINLTDVEYKIPSPYKLEELINTESLAYQGSSNINGSINKNDFIKIRPFGSAIFKIKEDK